MRRIIISALSAALAVTPAAMGVAFAQTQSQSDSPSEAAPAEKPAPGVRTIKVVDVDELPASTKTQVTANAAKQKPDDIVALRRSIDAMPQVSSALQQKGATSEQVIAAALDDEGTLTLITKKKGG
ncbi:hypothetical protein [Terrarubrum flagellatum]|uniref:hypothetical protein n=1 Tax=Terrirubrum flagellatum TaxID=2895980 RepID=UPI0031455A3A